MIEPDTPANPNVHTTFWVESQWYQFTEEAVEKLLTRLDAPSVAHLTQNKREYPEAPSAIRAVAQGEDVQSGTDEHFFEVMS